MIIYFCQGQVALDITITQQFMNKKSILQIIGVIFLLITISVSSVIAQDASVQQKNNPQQINNSNKIEVYARGTIYSSGDRWTDNDQTASLVSISTVKNMGLHVVSVDPKKIPYGSIILGRDNNGKKMIGVAVDTGDDVKSREAAKTHALAKGYDEDSPEYKALVLDFHSKKNITREWDTFTVIVYSGPDFKFDLNNRQKLKYLKEIKEKYSN